LHQSFVEQSGYSESHRTAKMASSGAWQDACSDDPATRGHAEHTSMPSCSSSGANSKTLIPAEDMGGDTSLCLKTSGSHGTLDDATTRKSAPDARVAQAMHAARNEAPLSRPSPVYATSGASSSSAAAVLAARRPASGLGTDSGNDPLNSTQARLRPFLNGFALSTWNTTALFAQTKRALQSRQRLDIIHDLVDRSHVVALQETHGNIADMQLMQSEIVHFLLYGSFHSNPAAGGVITMLSAELFQIPQAVNQYTIDEGRCIITTLFTIDSPVLVINIHLPPIYDAATKRGIFHRISDYSKRSEAIVFFSGRFQFCDLRGIPL
jgi:hypothetical protein